MTVESPTIASRALQARALRDQGLKYAEIAEALGISTSYVHALLSDPTGEKAKERKRSYARPCVDCGRPTNGSNGRTAETLRCGSCSPRHQHESRKWTPESIVEAIKRWAEVYGQLPRATDWNVGLAKKTSDAPERLARFRDSAFGPWPSATEVQGEMGGWNAAIIAAGFEPGRKSPPGPNTLTDVALAETAALYRSGLPLQTIADQLGMTPAAIRHRLNKVGEPVRTPKSRVLFDVDEAERLYLAGLSIPKVAAVLGANSTSVWRQLKRRAVPMRPQHGGRRKEQQMPAYSAATAVTKDMDKATARRDQLKLELAELEKYIEVLATAQAAFAGNSNGAGPHE